MFKRIKYNVSEAENLKHSYFEIKIDARKLEDLDKYLNGYGFNIPEGQKLGNHIIIWENLKSPFVCLKHNPRKEYQFLVQFCGIERPLAKGSFTRKFLEDILNEYSAQKVLFCGDIYEYKGGKVYCFYDGKNFAIDDKSMQRKRIIEEQKLQVEKQAIYIENLKVANMSR